MRLFALDLRPPRGVEWPFVKRFHPARPDDLPGSPPGGRSGQVQSENRADGGAEGGFEVPIGLKVQIRREDQDRLKQQAEEERLRAATAQKADATNAATRTESAAAGGPPPEEKPKPFVATGPKLGRNDPCHCGSGKKYKKCHGKKAAPVGGKDEAEDEEDEQG